jgi:hypothetical protein
MDRQGLESARRVVAALLLAKKNCSFYPEGHSACTASIEQFHSMLSRHIMAHGPLMLEVERDRLVSGGETAHDDDTGEQSLPFILFRDGIRWIEFQTASTSRRSGIHRDPQQVWDPGLRAGR